MTAPPIRAKLCANGDVRVPRHLIAALLAEDVIAGRCGMLERRGERARLRAEFVGEVVVEKLRLGTGDEDSDTPQERCGTYNRARDPILLLTRKERLVLRRALRMMATRRRASPSRQVIRNLD